MATLHEAARKAGVPFRDEVEPTPRRFAGGEVELHFLDWGNEDAPPVLLLHGFAQTAHSWDFVSLALADKYRVLAVDARGHGDSDWSSDNDYSTAAHQRDINALVDHLGCDSVCVIGLSMGGKTAYTFAGQHSDRVSALGIVDTGPVTEAGGGNRIRAFVGLPDQRESYEDFVQAVHDYQPLRSVEQIRATLIYNVRQMPNGKWSWKYDWILRSPDYRRSVTPAEEGWALLRDITCPTLLVRGALSDVLSPEVAREMTETISGCTFAEVEKAQHIVPGDNPAGFIAALLPWLERAYPGRDR